MIWRYRLILFIFVGSFFLIITRLFYWQGVRAEELYFLGKTQYGYSMVVLPKRGEIRTADNYPIVANKPSYLVFAQPQNISKQDKKKIISLLPPILDADPASISASLSLNLLWAPLKGSIDVNIKKEIEKLELPGIGFEEVSTPFYPEASMAAHLIGFVGKNDLGEDKGNYGLEGYYERQLKGKAGKLVETKDALGRPILAKIDQESGAINGRSLILSIDRSIQFTVERALKKGIERYQATGGMVGVMDPKTGNILAMASSPSFDPREYEKYEEKLYKNPFISSVYEPGSTFKALVMASALDAKVIKPDTKCPICGGPITIGEYQIKTWNNKYMKDITMVETIAHSDNTGMVFVSQSLGLDKMLDYLDKFGIGNTTGIDLQGEVAPRLRDRNYWYPIDVATAGFGQGISVTPIQLLDGFASLANGGKRMEPHIVSAIETPDKKRIPIEPKVLGTPISETTAKVITEILVNAVDKGEAKWAKPKGYRIAGKTGTAQIPIAGHYDANKTIASFMGFAPADDPKFVMLVIVDRPTTSIYGSETAAPIFFDIARDLLTYFGIPPTE